MLRLALASALFFVVSSCPDGLSTYYGGYCMRWDDWYNIYDNGFASCKKSNTHPPVIRSQADTDGFLAISKKYGRSNDLLLGLQCNTNTRLMEWIDGTPLTWQNFASSGQMNCKGTKYYLMNHKSGKWEEHTSGLLNTADLFCQYSNNQQDQTCFLDYNPIPRTDGTQSRYCYRVNGATNNWFTSESIGFRQTFGHNAIIHDSQTNDFLRRTAIASGFVNGFFIGLHRSSSGGVYQWADGSQVDYTNFAMSGNNGTGDCVIMDTLSSTGTWLNAECNSNKPTIYTQISKPYTSAASNFCNGGQLVGSATFTSPGFPLTANTQCSYTLVPGAGQRVQLTIDYLEANDCCDMLTVTIDGKAQTFTGANEAHTLTASNSNPVIVNWQPSSGSGVKGFHATFVSTF